MIRVICQREAENPVAPQSTTPPNNPVRMKKKIDEKTDAMDAEMNFFTLPKTLALLHTRRIIKRRQRKRVCENIDNIAEELAGCH
jgi:hypothetical protein